MKTIFQQKKKIEIWTKISGSAPLKGAPEVPSLYRETQSVGQQMLNAPVGINGLSSVNL